MKLFFLAASVKAADNFTVLESHKLPTAKYKPTYNVFKIADLILLSGNLNPVKRILAHQIASFIHHFENQCFK